MTPILPMTPFPIPPLHQLRCPSVTPTAMPVQMPFTPTTMTLSLPRPMHRPFQCPSITPTNNKRRPPISKQLRMESISIKSLGESAARSFSSAASPDTSGSPIASVHAHARSHLVFRLDVRVSVYHHSSASPAIEFSSSANSSSAPSSPPPVTSRVRCISFLSYNRCRGDDVVTEKCIPRSETEN